MPFPYSLKQELLISSEEYELSRLPENTEEVLKRSLLDKGLGFEDGLFTAKNSLFGIPYRFSIKLSFEERGLRITSKILLHNFVNALLIINLLMAFFSGFKFDLFLWFMIGVDIVLYAFNLLIVKNGLQNTIKKLFEGYRIEIEA